MSTLTSANSVLMIGIANLYNVPVQIQGYATDDAFTTEDVETAETMMGVDGKLSAGFTPYPVTLDINLQADSASNLFFDAWIAAEATQREKYVASATILLPGTSFLYAFTRGFMTKVNVMPAAKKVLQPRKFTIVFQSISRAPV
jgi:hypothetical protein